MENKIKKLKFIPIPSDLITANPALTQNEGYC